MKKLRKAFMAGLTLSLLSACGTPTTTSSDPSIESMPSSSIVEEVAHAFTLKYIDGDPIAEAMVVVKDQDGNMVASGKTNEEGVFSFNAPASVLTLSVSGMPAGYFFKEDIKFEANQTELEAIATSEVIDETMDDGHTYALNDIMYDFSWTDSDNKLHSLRETLKKKELVILNFWYTSCSNCVNEYPYMINAYKQYKNDIEIFGLTFETNAQAKTAKSSFGCTWPMGYDEGNMIEAFNIGGYPTSVFIDRYGRIDYVEAGSMLGDMTWTNAISKYLGEDYVPAKWKDERVKPDIDMPPSSDLEAAACSSGFSTTFRNEENEEDAEWNWPWIVSEDGKSIRPSNQYIDSSYSIVYFDVALEKDQCFAFDYLSSTEKNADNMYVFVDRKPQVAYSGVETEWKTSYTYVATKSATYEFAFCYYKDSGDYLGEDTFYVNNMRILGLDQIAEPTYILRTAASGNYSQFTNKYANYINPVYNEGDGYYHVDKVDGPLLMANFLESSQLTEYSLYDYAANGAFKDVNGVDYTDIITDYATEANATKVGYLPVTQEIRGVLETIINYMSNYEYDEQWLEVCVYYNAYGTGGVEMEDPTIGISPNKPIEAKMGDQNYAVFDHVIMPRGLKFYFDAPSSGVYQINSIGSSETESWVYDSSRKLIYKSEDTLLRSVIASDEGDGNFYEWVYLEEGERIYITVAYADIYEFNTLQFEISNKGESYDVFQACSPGYYSTNIDAEGNMTDIIRLGIDIKLGEDGYYHELRKDGTLGSIVYLDVTEPTQLFSLSIQKMAKNKDPYTGFGFFDCTVDEDGNEVKGGKDYTQDINAYLKTKVIIDDGDTFGCIAVDKGLATIMQAFMDKYSFANIEGSWLKLCYYFMHFEK